MGTHSKTNQVSRAKQLVTGTNKHFPNGAQPVQFGNETHTISEVVGTIESFVTIREGTEAAQATAKVKLENERAQSPKLLAFIAAWVTFLKAAFGNSPDILGDFGIPTRKAPPPKTAEQKAAAAAKRKATREARNTMGKRQRQDVKGNVTAKLVVTPLAPPQPVASPATSPAAPAGSSAPAAPASPAPPPVPTGNLPSGGGTTPHGA